MGLVGFAVMGGACGDDPTRTDPICTTCLVQIIDPMSGVWELTTDVNPEYSGNASNIHLQINDATYGPCEYPLPYLAWEDEVNRPTSEPRTLDLGVLNNWQGENAASCTTGFPMDLNGPNVGVLLRYVPVGATETRAEPVFSSP